MPDDDEVADVPTATEKNLDASNKEMDSTGKNLDKTDSKLEMDDGRCDDRKVEAKINSIHRDKESEKAYDLLSKMGFDEFGDYAEMIGRQLWTKSEKMNYQTYLDCQ